MGAADVRCGQYRVLEPRLRLTRLVTQEFPQFLSFHFGIEHVRQNLTCLLQRSGNPDRLTAGSKSGIDASSGITRVGTTFLHHPPGNRCKGLPHSIQQQAWPMVATINSAGNSHLVRHTLILNQICQTPNIPVNDTRPCMTFLQATYV